MHKQGCDPKTKVGTTKLVAKSLQNYKLPLND
jgi:hypothetical protein